eukprot:CAMPEP_0173296568 /NCGR_PEP_ID=MMETSP1143-20121109/15028_1 /TAXON_ID=483371 /ORGANISM="non described non described, Strain CCMP2298" /LENGTH=186 /DNA_ID=CAMNT_0014236425 /DNA_START=93 /DNA_END=650 /DNA_ORIENTATION=-
MAAFDAGMVEIINSLKEAQVLRLSCSDIAALTGFNPWSRLDELFEKYLYQDLPELLDLDASLVGARVLTLEAEVDAILSNLPAQQRATFATLQRDLGDERLDSATKAQEMLLQVQALVQQKEVQAQLTPAQVVLVESEFKGRVRKGYGINCENANLDRYERIVGFPVLERNMRTIKMQVMPEKPEK